uniref:SH3 domain-containing protein n=1 Tax=Amphimedon queenslandica TaxID=400682 RepID=A0A1X7TS43_AMPQE
MEESLLDADTIRKIRNAVSADEGMSLFRQAFEEHPTLLHEMRIATGKIEVSLQKTLKTSPPPPVPKLCQKSLPTYTPASSPVQNTQPPPVPPRYHKKPSTAETLPTPKPRSNTGPSLSPQALVATPSALPSPEYITMREMLADLVDLLTGNAPAISQLNNHLFSSDLIPKAVHVTVGTTGLTPYDRANKIFSSVLATLECHPNPNSVFSSLITSLQKIGLNSMAYKLMKNLKRKGGHADPNLEQQPSVSMGPLQPVDVTAQSHTPQPTITGSQSSTPTTVIELSSKDEVAINIGSLHSRFASLDTKIRGEITKIVQNPHYDFFSCGVLKHLTDTYLSTAQTELTQYIDSVDKFSESSQLKHIRSTIKEKLSSLPPAASPNTSDQAKPVVIKLNDRWEEMTISKLKAVLKHYFGVTSDLFSHISFDYGSFVITLLVPTSLSQSIIDLINKKTNSMGRLGILEVSVDKDTIPIRREGDNNFDISLHESVKVGDSFEVSMLLQLGADPNSKDERGKSAVEIADEGGHTQIKEILLTAGEKDQWTQSLDTPTAESIYTARIDYHGIRNGHLSFSEGEQLEIYEKDDIFWWKGRSLVSGDERDIPSSCVYSMLESLQLLEFILSVEEVSLPILQKIRNDSSSNDEKASLFLETINDDPIMISALRQDKEQHDKGVTGSVDWYSGRVILYSPSPVQCNEVISNINNNHKEIILRSLSTNSTVSLLSSTKLHTLNLRSLEILYTPLTNDCIQYLCILLTNNKTIQELVIRFHSISDRGVTNICQALEHNSTLTSLDLINNPLITSTSGQALSHLLLNNSSLVELDLRKTSLSTESIPLILQSLMDNKKIRRLWLDNRHEETCINTYPNYHLIQDRVDWKR